MNAVSAGDAGLFGTINAGDNLATIENVLLVNAKVTGQNAGSLVGLVRHNLTVNNCGAYIDIAFNHTDVPDYVVGTTGDAGGLIGNSPNSAAREINIKNSFASTVVRGGEDAGGLIGGAGGNGTYNIDHSYAACYIEAGNAEEKGGAGGLVGRENIVTAKITITNSYAAGIIFKTGDQNHPGGFISDNIFDGPTHHNSNVTVSNSYAAVRYSDEIINKCKTVTDYVVSGVAYGLTGSYVTNAYYIRQAGVKYADNSGTSVSTKQLSEMKTGTSGILTLTGDWYKPTEPADNPTNPSYATFPYKQTAETADLTTPYPYPMLNSGDMPMLHYGDWLEQDIYGYMFYWEKEGTAYHFYTRVPDGAGGTKEVSNLCKEYHLDPAEAGQSVTEWGYVLVGSDLELPTELDGLKVKGPTDLKENLDKFVNDPENTTAFANTALADLLGEAGSVIYFKGEKSTANRFYTVETDDGWLEFNLAFAAAVNIVKADDAPTAPTIGTAGDPYQIRTVLQLDNIPSEIGYYKQTHDLNALVDGVRYPGYTGPSSFGGSYDGGKYRILELDITNGGLINTIQRTATLKDIILYSPTGNATIVSSYDCGGLAGGILYGSSFSVTIDNCVVAGYTLSGTECGGLVGRIGTTISLTINKCAAVNTLNSSGTVGGLVGSANGNTIRINNSYAGGEINSSATSNASGILGSYTGSSTCIYNSVYSYVDLSGVTGGGNVYGIGPGKATGSGTVYNGCSYWKGGLGDNSAIDTEVTGLSLDGLKVAGTPNAKHTYRPGANLEEGLTERTGDEVYPFQAVVPGPKDELVHYGDWPEEVEASSLCYYEKYDDDTFGVYGYLTPGGTLVNTLKKDKNLFVVEDGYFVPVKVDETNIPTVININGSKVSLTPSSSSVEIESGNYYLYSFVPGVDGTTGDYYTPIKVGSTDKYWFNPAFACEVLMAEPRDADTPEKKTVDGKEYDVIIRTARQLANLAKATGSVYNKGDSNQEKFQGLNYVQQLDIDYDKYTGSGVIGKDNNQMPASLNSGSYNGNKFIIRNLHIGESSEGTGLFGNSKGDLTGIRLVNIHVSGGQYVGALVGRFQGNKIEDCGVYADSDDYYKNCVVEGTDYVGGLIGNYNTADGATLKECFAAVSVSGDRQVGGLIGSLSVREFNITITDCYSGGRTEGGNYTSANVSGDRNGVGGLIGCVAGDTSGKRTTTVTFSGTNYSTCSVTTNDVNLGLLIGRVDGDVKIDPDTGATVYALGVATDGKSAQKEDYLTTPVPAGSITEENTHPYDEDLKGKKYPYQSGQTEHYGDWEQKVQVTGYIYWELEDGTYNYSVTAFKKEAGDPDWKELTTIDPTICNEYDTTGISDYGYGWFYAGDFDSAPTMTGVTATPDTGAKGALESSLKTALETALSGVDLNTVTVTAYSYNDAAPAGTTQTWSINTDGTSPAAATLNPDFADTIKTDGTVDTPYKIRTIRQLQHVNSYLTSSFIQGHDLDGKDVTYTPIGNGTANGFTGNYDGKGYRIRHLNIEVEGNVANAGLFGRVSGDGEFKNIIMWGENNTISANGLGENSISSGYARIGGIIAEVSSGNVTISNCVVAGYTLTGVADGCDNVSYHNYVIEGGIVGSLRGSVVNCEAVVNIEAKAGGSTGIWGRRRIVASVGGLVGEINSGRVENSYAGGRITALDNDLANLTDSNIGGLVGDSNSNTVDHCFSYVSYVGDSNRYYYIDGRGSNHESCAYLGANNTRNNRAHQCANFTDLSSWFTDNAAFFHTPSQINGEAVTNPTFNGAVVQVPINSDGTHAYVHYGDLPTGAEVAGDPGIEGPEIMAALPPDPPEEVPDPTPTEPDPGSGGKEEKPE